LHQASARPDAAADEVSNRDRCFLTDAELDVYERAFRRTGTRGSFNWYRAIDLNWEDARRIPDPTIRVPSLMITAENDPILRPALAEPMPTEPVPPRGRLQHSPVVRTAGFTHLKIPFRGVLPNAA